jgi:hypothetical protein
MSQTLEIEDLKHALNAEIENYARIEDCLKKKQVAVIENNLEQVYKIDSEIEQLTEHAQHLEKGRLEILVLMDKDKDSLQSFIKNLQDNDDATLLNTTRTQLLETIQSIQTLSEQNSSLLKQSIHFVEQSVHFIAEILSPSRASYAPPSNENNSIYRSEGSSTVNVNI